MPVVSRTGWPGRYSGKTGPAGEQALVVFSQEIAEAVEGGVPLGAAFGDPVLDSTEGLGFKAAKPDPALFFCADEASALEDLDVLDGGCEGEGERAGQGRDRYGPGADALDHGQARGIAEGGEEAGAGCECRGGHDWWPWRNLPRASRMDSQPARRMARPSDQGKKAACSV